MTVLLLFGQCAVYASEPAIPGEHQPPLCLYVSVPQTVLSYIPKSVRPTDMKIHAGLFVDLWSTYNALTGLSKWPRIEAQNAVEVQVRRDYILRDFLSKNPKELEKLKSEIDNEQYEKLCDAIEAQNQQEPLINLETVKEKMRLAQGAMEGAAKEKKDCDRQLDYVWQHVLTPEYVKENWAVGLSATWDREVLSRFVDWESIKKGSAHVQLQDGGRELMTKLGISFDKNLWPEKLKNYRPYDTSVDVSTRTRIADFPYPQHGEAQVEAVWDGNMLPKKIDDTMKPEARVSVKVSTLTGFLMKLSVQFKRWRLCGVSPQGAVAVNGKGKINLSINASSDDGQPSFISKTW